MGVVAGIGAEAASGVIAQRLLTFLALATLKLRAGTEATGCIK